MKRKLSFIVLLSFFAFSHAQQSRILLLWDSSLGMQQKDLQAELSQLNQLLDSRATAEVHLKIFSNQVYLEQQFANDPSGRKELKKSLETVIYDGTASYQGLFSDNYDEIILVSRGMEFIDKLPTYHDTPVYIINSCRDSNEVDLKVLALASEGDYYSLMSELSESDVAEDDEVAFSRVQTVRTGSELATADSGRREALDEVLLETERQEQEDELMDLGDRKRSKKSLGYAVESISSEDIAPTDTDVQQAVKGQFSGLYIQNDTANDDVDLTQFLGRNKNMTILGNQYGLVVIDGVPQASDSSAFGAGLPSSKGRTDHIDPANIHSITYLKGLAATNRYGSLGSGGVLVIKTKTFAATEGTISQRKKKARPLGTTPTYDGSAQSENNASQPYMVQITQSEDVNEAYETYLIARTKYGQRASFYVDMANYFKTWGNNDIIDRILSNINQLPNAGAGDLMAMAYSYQSLGMHKQAAGVYKRLTVLEDDSVQHFRNLAMAYTDAGMYKEAEDIYNRLDRGYIKTIRDNEGLRKTLDLETKRLVKKARSTTTLRKLDPKFDQLKSQRKRVVLEWNYWDAQFDLQVVNPQNRFFTWSHRPDAEAARFNQDKQQGIGLEEFTLTEADKGNWLFNLTNFGSQSARSGEPVYLKITVYDNFGAANEKVTTKLITLDQINQNRELISVSL